MISLKSAFLRLDKNDFAKGLLLAFLAPILTFLAAAVGVPGFSFVSVDWGMLWKIGLASMIAYLVKNYFSDGQGKVLGGLFGKSHPASESI